jgi:hypothetical protein
MSRSQPVGGKAEGRLGRRAHSSLLQRPYIRLPQTVNPRQNTGLRESLRKGFRDCPTRPPPRSSPAIKGGKDVVRLSPGRAGRSRPAPSALTASGRVLPPAASTRDVRIGQVLAKTSQHWDLSGGRGNWSADPPSREEPLNHAGGKWLRPGRRSAYLGRDLLRGLVRSLRGTKERRACPRKSGRLRRTSLSRPASVGNGTI